MIPLRPARKSVMTGESGQIQPVTQNARVERLEIFNPPPNGLTTVDNLASNSPNALVLENFRKNARSIVPRGGYVRRVKAPAKIQYMFEYSAAGTPVYFAATATGVYKFTEATPSLANMTAEFTGQTGYDYSHVETQNDGGKWLHLVNGNGTDYMRLYNGTTWQTVTAVSTPHAITGVDTRFLNSVWNYNSRIFFTQKDTLTAWYLNVNAVSGAASKLSLGGIFRRGGSLLFGGAISGDAGDGSDDRCVFVTDRGEFCVFMGNDPSAFGSWRLQGVYDIGEPTGRNAYFRLAGDMIVATKQGLISLNMAMQFDGSQLLANAFSKPIQSDWQFYTRDTSLSSPWRVTKITNSNIVYLLPNEVEGAEFLIFVLDLETLSWSTYTGWNASTLASFAGSLYFGDDMGWVNRADVGGLDNGEPFECRLAFHFRDLGAPGSLKMAKRVEEVWRSDVDFSSKISVETDYIPKFGLPPAEIPTDQVTSSFWDFATWDVSQWGREGLSYSIRKRRKGVCKKGEVLTVQAQVLSSNVNKLNCELISLRLSYVIADYMKGGV